MTQRERCCVKIALLFTLNRRDQAESFLSRTQHKSRFSSLFLDELFIHLSLVLGFPAMLEGLELARRIHPLKRNLKQRRIGVAGGQAILRRVYGPATGKLLMNLQTIHPEAAKMIVRDVYGRIFTRKGLTLREREFINLTVLCLQGFDRQLYSHIRGALRAGATERTVHEALRMVAVASRTRARRGYSILELVVSQGKKL